MMQIKLYAALLAIFSVFMVGVGSEMEASAIKHVKMVVQGGGGAVDDPRIAKAQAKLEDLITKEKENVGIIRDRFSMFLIAGGAFGGAVVCLLLRLAMGNDPSDPVKKMTRAAMASYFTVSLLSSIFLCPYALKRWLNSEPEECFAWSFLGAVFAWVMWGIGHAIGKRVLKAAEARGWLGVKDEILGGHATVSTMQAPGLPTAKPMETPKDRTAS